MRLKVKRGKNHGLSKSPAYCSWQDMKTRCYNPRRDKYLRYGGRGIRVCDRWLHFVNFLEDMGERPPGHTLDRIDNDGNYEPGNCRWATPTVQSNNNSRNKKIVIAGVEKTQTQWCRHYGISLFTFRSRLLRGISPLEALTNPLTPIVDEKFRRKKRAA
jgi:hypothetical protein